MAASKRKITVDGREYEYIIGKANCAIWDFNTGAKIAVVKLDKLTGRSWDTLERGRRKITSDGMVTPKHVADYIKALK